VSTIESAWVKKRRWTKPRITASAMGIVWDPCLFLLHDKESRSVGERGLRIGERLRGYSEGRIGKNLAVLREHRWLRGEGMVELEAELWPGVRGRKGDGVERGQVVGE